jgi:hypothetical protein
MHNIDLETVTCEVVFNAEDISQPDEIQWFDMSKNSFQLNSDRKLITANLVNMSNTFRLTDSNKNLFKPSNIYHCCAVVNHLPVLCATSYLTNNKSISTNKTTAVNTENPQTSTISMPTTNDNQLETIFTTFSTFVTTNPTETTTTTTTQITFLTTNTITTSTTITQSTFITINPITNATTQTKITTSTTQIEYLEIVTDNFDPKEKVLVKTPIGTYVSMLAKTKKIKVTCRKLTLREGIIVVSLNGIQSSATNCNSYSIGFPSDDFYCLSKTFDYDLTNIESADDYFSVVCSIAQMETFTFQSKLNKLCKFYRFY